MLAVGFAGMCLLLGLMTWTERSPAARAAAVGALSLGLLAVFLVASLIAQWFDELVRRALAKVRPVPRTGYVVLAGVARSLDAGAVVASRTRLEMASPVGVNDWIPFDEKHESSPFVLELGGGEEIEVDAERPVLDGFAEVSSLPPGGDVGSLRALTATVRAGDRVWVSGRLEPAPHRSGGVYRTSRVRRRLVPGGREPLVISRELPAARWSERARAHRIGAYAAAASLALLHATGWRRFDAALAGGAALEGAGAQLHRGSIALGAVLLAGAVAVWIGAVAVCRRKLR